jgi:FkbM family methyltransferase
MVTLRGLLRAIQTTKNFWDAFSLKIFNGQRQIVFKNGIVAELNWAEYCRLRDLIEDLRDRSFTFEKVEGKYCLRKLETKFVYCEKDLKGAYDFFNLILHLNLVGWSIEQVKDARTIRIAKDGTSYFIKELDEDLFRVQSEKMNLIGPVESVQIFFEDCPLYDCDFVNKTVLDIGAFCGETAVFFSGRGAKKVILYEPVLAHHELIKKNLSLNKINAELYDLGIGRNDGTKIVRYNEANPGFALFSEGKNEMEIRLKKVEEVIAESEADIAKIDCEGAEDSLIDVPEEILRKITFYIIETHSPPVQRAISTKFAKAGFMMVRAPAKVADGVSVLHFRKL